MTVAQVVFILLTLIGLGSALLVVTTKNLFHAALYLIVSFFAVSGFYVLLEAGFFAAAQFLVYIGAISILFIFATMLTRTVRGMEPANSQWQAALILSVFLFVVMVAMLSPVGFSLPIRNDRIFGGVEWQVAQNQKGELIPVASNIISNLGFALADPNQYGIALILAGILLLIGMVGAIWVARERKPREIIAEKAILAAEEAQARARISEVKQQPEVAVAHESHH
jgi:NADH-quinone oxidoreductase subunit J